MAGTAVPTTIAHRSRGVVRTEIALTCDASGVTTAATVGVGFGVIKQVHYDGGLDASAVITVSDAKTGATLFTYTTGTENTPTSFHPTINVVDTAGTAVAAATGAINVWRDIKVAGKVNVAVASGGTSETGKLVIIVDETPAHGLSDKALTV
jgi:hypothetical protein